MLKTSPILTSSPGTPSSTAPFRHAPTLALSSHDSPRQPVPAPRRISSIWTSSSAVPMKSQSSSKPQPRSPGPQALTTHRSASTSTSSLHTVTITTEASPATPGSEFDPSHTRASDHDEQITAEAFDVTAIGRHGSQPTTPLPTHSVSDHNASSTSGIVTAETAAVSASPASAHPATATTATNPDTTTATAQPPVTQEPSSALSPGKRRGSPPASIGNAVASVQDSSRTQQDVYSLSKRPKHDQASPKILPRRYEFCAVEDMVELIAYMLAELITTNDAIRMSNGRLTRFHSRTAPGISVRDYLHRLARHATLTPPLLLAMVYYIDRLCAMYQDFTINTLTVHRFLITAATVAAKGLSDAFWNNTTYARVGGVRVAELKLLELDFLTRVDWRIVPNPEELVAYYMGLVERTPGYEIEAESSSDDNGEDTEDLDVDSDD